MTRLSDYKMRPSDWSRNGKGSEPRTDTQGKAFQEGFKAIKFKQNLAPTVKGKFRKVY